MGSGNPRYQAAARAWAASLESDAETVRHQGGGVVGVGGLQPYVAAQATPAVAVPLIIALRTNR